MTLTQLTYIVAVDKYRHFATAAQKIYITQPTLSMQIQKLEDDLGVLIFDRSRSPVVPTEIGKQIIEQAKIILSGAKHIQDIANQSGEEIQGTFRIGIIPTIAPYLVPLFLKNFIQKYPKVELIFEELVTETILRGLQEDLFDVGIVATPVEDSTLFEIDLFLEPFLAYISKEHSLSGREKISIEDLSTEDLWLLNEGHCFRDQTVKLCRQSNQKMRKSRVSFESGNLETLKKLVEENFGMTLLPWLAVYNHDTNCAPGLLKEFEDPVPSRKIRLVYSRKYLKQRLIKALEQEIQRSVSLNNFEGEIGIIVD